MLRSKSLLGGVAGLALLITPLAGVNAYATDPTPSPGASASTPSGTPSASPTPTRSETSPSTQEDTPSPSETSTSSETPTPSTTPSTSSSTPAKVAAPTLTASGNVDVGQTVTIRVSGCTAPADGILLRVLDAKGKKTDYPIAALDGSQSVKTTVAGWYAAQAVCTTGDTQASDPSNKASFFAYPTGIDFSPTSWRQGQALTLTTYGFQAGESVRVKVVHQKTGKVYWNTTRTASASGDERKNVFSNVVLPTGPAGNYDITMTGSQSGKVRSSVFYWQSPDSNGNGGGNPGTTPKVPAHHSSDRPGLPSTGV
ncbi:hypothetical protein [Acidipropionibacterium virtanenii]|uniref:Uncharacterized protein n=1 Tax=Acidipropionibacterium virtanenii TaxID=2057246 RepID=A0A344US63_9ACTN|nr:hypothetical protein [Acidipropionibacterium virtanenii]AXE38111.1 hypothetical protein JS278_00928 [Acidipropionibacterium virtanenii]